jgi:hypothetical protein
MVTETRFHTTRQLNPYGNVQSAANKSNTANCAVRNDMTIVDAIKILTDEIEARKNSHYDYDELVTEAMERLLEYAKISAPR